jgi:hypothetical protein
MSSEDLSIASSETRLFSKSCRWYSFNGNLTRILVGVNDHPFVFSTTRGKKKATMSVNSYHVFHMKGRASKEQMSALWPTVKQSFEKLVGETKQAGDTNAGVAARIIETWCRCSFT